MTEFKCPICNEQMINLSQLNQHIDDLHNDNQMNNTSIINSHDNLTSTSNNSENDKNKSPKPISKSPSYRRTTPVKKINKLAFTEQGFSIGDTNSRDSSPEPISNFSSTNSNKNSTSSTNNSGNHSNEISRKHWKHAQSQSQLKCKICSIKLNVKNGIVNCRKCGELYCNEHTHYQIKLRNPNPDDPTEKLPQFDSSSNGKLSRCCQLCFMEKMQAEVNVVDLTKEFKSKRQIQIDSNQLHRTKIQRNFIKLINLMIDKRFTKQPSKQNSSSFIQTTSKFISIFQIDDDEKDLVGNNWKNDSIITNCTICFTKFNFIIRKHHCRLCGEIVCDDSNGVRKNCSMYVPIMAFMEKLPNLNYSTRVKDNWSNIDDDLRFRCCVNCKNAILYDWKKQNGSTTTIEVGEDLSVFTMYEGLFLQKQQILKLIKKYEEGSIKTDQTKNLNTKQQEDNLKIGHKLMLHLKEFEISLLNFKKKFFTMEDNKIIVRDEYQLRYNKILMNIYQSIATFLQENIIKYRDINELQNSLIKQNLANESATNDKDSSVSIESSPLPRLTKKQIRELREQLMVLNEQKFLVEKTIDEFTKNRKFDELTSLIDNKNEIVQTINNLEEELGEFGF
ncbi:PEP7 [Candida pseudojiufengensis]|uniref:PEP7 n=1 Tax=Candida pseudojiufengensis TaxID=497109 RepID=UPI002224876B|nr:PEP7 [Candida pseudojiufengensis]KAI5959390.1 PEP7 [Candida pseudojiufengensis]